MREELDKLLCKRYWKIFQDRNAPMNQTCMCWGFSCGDGWYWLIDNLCLNIQNRIDTHNSNWLKYKDKESSWYHGKQEIPQVVAIQVKEKFSGLRFYYGGGDEEIRGMVDFAELLSYHICEECGSTKDIGCTTGWLTTLCQDCYNKREKKTKFDLQTSNAYDRFYLVEQLKESDICYYNEEKVTFSRHISEYEKEILDEKNEKQIVDRRYLFLDKEESEEE
jgi:hypothetical protein